MDMIGLEKIEDGTDDFFNNKKINQEAILKLEDRNYHSEWYANFFIDMDEYEADVYVHNNLLDKLKFNNNWGMEIEDALDNIEGIDKYKDNYQIFKSRILDLKIFIIVDDDNNLVQVIER